MAKISDAALTITQNTNGTSRAVVRCKVTFTPYEMNQMKSGLRLRLKAELWGDDAWVFGGDDKLYTYTPIKYFPDAAPTTTETITFDTIVGEGVLDEDIGRDEIYARLMLTNLYTMVTASAKTNTINRHF